MFENRIKYENMQTPHVYIEFIPIDMQDSPRDESLCIDEPLDAPDDVDVMDAAPGDVDNKDDAPDAPSVESIENGEGDTDGCNPSLPASSASARSLLLLQEDLLGDDLEAGRMEG